jgi:hypothetical protein
MIQISKFEKYEIVFMFLCSRSPDLFIDGCITFYLIIRKIMNFKIFQKYIHNGSGIVHKNVRSSMVKTVFESHVSLRNCREKIGEIRVNARMQAYVSLRQLLSGITSRLRRGFYAVTNWF